MLYVKDNDKYYYYHYDYEEGEWIKTETTESEYEEHKYNLLSMFIYSYNAFIYDSDKKAYILAAPLNIDEDVVMNSASFSFKNNELIAGSLNVIESNYNENYEFKNFGTTVIEIPTKVHEHTYSKEWSYDEFEHWHQATCSHSDLYTDRESHTFENGFCTICGKSDESLNVVTSSMWDFILTNTFNYSATISYEIDGNIYYEQYYKTENATLDVMGDSKNLHTIEGDKYYYYYKYSENDWTKEEVSGYSVGGLLIELSYLYSYFIYDSNTKTYILTSSVDDLISATIGFENNQIVSLSYNRITRYGDLDGNIEEIERQYEFKDFGTTVITIPNVD